MRTNKQEKAREVYGILKPIKFNYGQLSVVLKENLVNVSLYCSVTFEIQLYTNLKFLEVALICHNIKSSRGKSQP